MKFLSHSILLLICLLTVAQVSYACTCEQRKIQDEVEETSFIFVGKVIEILEDKSYVPPKLKSASKSIQKIIDTRKRFIVKFKVKSSIKGVKEKEITLVQYRQDFPCSGIYLDENQTYLIYAFENKEKEIVDGGLCSRTRKFNKKSKDYKKLLKLKKEKPELF